MRRLLLIRHGKAAPAAPDRDDFTRPLSAAGEQEVAAVAGRLAGSAWVPECLIASTAPRALATAAMLAERLAGMPLIADETLYLAGSETLRQALARHGGDYRTLAVVGHNPGLTLFVRELAGIRLDDLPTAGIVGIGFDSGSWQQLGTGRLDYFDAPLWPQMRGRT